MIRIREDNESAHTEASLAPIHTHEHTYLYPLTKRLDWNLIQLIIISSSIKVVRKDYENIFDCFDMLPSSIFTSHI